MEKVCIVTSGFLPLPATKGGAVENLIENFIYSNEKNKKVDLEIFSVYDNSSKKESNKINNTKFNYIKINFLVRFFDLLIFYFAKYFLRKKNSHSYRFILQRLYFYYLVSLKLKKGDYDKIVLENHFSQYLVLKWNKNYIKYKDKYYYHCHNDVSSFYGCKDIIENTRGFICISEYIKDSLMNYLKLDGNKFFVLKNMIDNKKIFKISSIEELNKYKLDLGLDDKDNIILFVGRLVPEKGIKELLSAMFKVDDTVKLIVVGNSIVGQKKCTSFELELKSMVEKLGNRVIFTGYVPYAELYKYYNLCDFTVLPSVWKEPAGLTIVESMIFGKPSITTRIGGIPEYTNDESAVLLDVDDLLIDNLANSINDLIAHKEKLQIMSKCASDIYKDSNIDNYFDDFVDIISKG